MYPVSNVRIKKAESHCSALMKYMNGVFRFMKYPWQIQSAPAVIIYRYNCSLPCVNRTLTMQKEKGCEEQD